MPFDESPIHDLRAILAGSELRLWWTSTADPGSWFQVYVAGDHVATTQQTQAVVPLPDRQSVVHVGAVSFAERYTDFGSSLSHTVGTSASVLLSWLGGHFLGGDLAGFNVYQSPEAGAAVDTSKPVGYVAALPAGTLNGAGLGGAGQGGAGEGAVQYTWTSGRLGQGVWSFQVTPVDAAGHQDGDPASCSVSVLAAPRAPAPDPQGRRLTYTLAGLVPTLHWLPSPDA